MGGAAHFNDNDITRNDISGFAKDRLSIADDFCLECDIGLELSDDVSSLFFLIPTDEGVEHEDTDDDTEINLQTSYQRRTDQGYNHTYPITETGSEDDGQLHGVENGTLEEGKEFEE